MELLADFDTDALLNWFDSHRIDYPWSRNKNPYRVWVSEVMLQQTVAASVISYFERWIADFPGIKDLAAADLQSVLSHWEGLGYYSRCRNLHKAAVYLTEEKKGLLPETYGELTRVPGIGDYTARAILSIAFGKSYPVLDANVKRIIQRLAALPVWEGKTEKRAMAFLEKIIPGNRPGAFNEAMMQLGQQICTAGNPSCGSCPLRRNCGALAGRIADTIPAKKVKKIKMSEKTVLLFHSNGKILLRRKKQGLFHDLWLLPTVEENSCKRMERLNSEWSFLDTKILSTRHHFYTDNKDTLSPCLISSDEMDLSCMTPGDDENYEHRWVDVKELDEYPSPSVYRKILDEVKEYL